MKHNKRIKFLEGRVSLPWGGGSFSSFMLIILSLVMMGVSALRPQTYDALRSQISDFFAPVLSFASRSFQQASYIMHDVAGFAQLQIENTRLEQENVKLRAWYQVALLLEAENKSLRVLLNLGHEPAYDYLSARVIADGGKAYVKTLLLSAGQEHGVRKGAAVLSGDGLAGRIVDVGRKTARILLVTDTNARVPVTIEGTGQHAIMAGTNGALPRLLYLSQDSETPVGARLVTSGYGGMYPQGLPVGRVIMDAQGVKSVALFVQFSALQIVRIVQKKGE